MTKECLYLCVCCTVAAALAGPVSRVTAEGPATAIRAPVSAPSSRPISLGLLPVNASGGDERSVTFRGLVKKWDRILELVPRLWDASVLGDRIQIAGRNIAYFSAVKATASKEQFEKTLWDYIKGTEPKVRWRWDENPVAEAIDFISRYEAAGWLRRLLKAEGRLKEIEGNPLVPDEAGDE